MPKFGSQETGQRTMARYASEACLGQECNMIGEASGAEASKDTEAKIKGTDDDLGGKAHGAGWDAEI